MTHRASGDRTSTSLSDELPHLLAERGLSFRGLARLVGVNQSHISRILSADGKRRVSTELAGDIAVALDLPRDYFSEYREGVVIDAVVHDPVLREAIYSRIGKEKAARARPRRA